MTWRYHPQQELHSKQKPAAVREAMEVICQRDMRNKPWALH